MYKHDTVPGKIDDCAAPCQDVIADYAVNIKADVKACLADEEAVQLLMADVTDGHPGECAILHRMPAASSSTLHMDERSIYVTRSWKLESCPEAVHASCPNQGCLLKQRRL